MHGRTIAFAAAICAAWLTASMANAEVVELAKLEKRALEKHALLAAGALRERAAAAEVRQAESAYLPRVGMNVEANAAPGRRLLEIDPGGYLVQGALPLAVGGNNGKALKPRPRFGVGVELTENLYDFGRTQAAVAASRAKHRAAEADSELSRSQLVEMVRGAYLGWLTAHELHRLAITASSDAARRRERVAELIAEGARSRTDLPPVDADHLLSELERERAAGELAAARLTLEQCIGESLPTAAQPDLALLVMREPPAGPSQPDPALRLLAHQRDALRATARVQRKQRAPLLGASLGAGIYAQQSERMNQEPQLSYLPSYTVGVALTVPLWDGGEASAAADAADARSAELGLRMESAERTHSQQLERARLDAEHAQKRQEMAEKLLAVCTTRVTDVEAGYELGVMQFDQVQQARALLRRAETEVVLSKIARTEAVLRVAPK